MKHRLLVAMTRSRWSSWSCSPFPRRFRRRPPARRRRRRRPLPPPREVIDRYCVTCHNQRLRRAGWRSTRSTRAGRGRGAEVWEKVVRKLRLRAMPPDGARRPDEATYDALIAWLETELDRAAASRPNPGGPLLHRLNRAEYANAIRDLLALDVDVASLLPPDDSAYGFDNIADVLGVSPSLLERYLSAARKNQRAGGRRSGDGAGAEHLSRAAGLSQDQHVEGLPLGTVGGMLVAPHLSARRRVRLPGDAVADQPGHDARPRVSAPGRVSRSTASGSTSRRSAATTDLAAAFEKPTETGDAIDARLRVRVPVRPARTRWASRSSRSCPASTAVRLQPFLRSSSDTSTGPACRTSRCSRSPGRSTRPVRRHAEPAAHLHRAGRHRRGRRDGVRRRASSRRWRGAPIAGR